MEHLQILIDNDGQSSWTRQDSKFISYVEGIFNEEVSEYNWSGGNNQKARLTAAQKLADIIYEWSLENPDEPVRITGHSHGGNVGIMAINILAKKGVKVETLITIATPVRGYKLEKDTQLGQHIHLYNTADEVQVNGGNAWLLGAAGREFKNAENVKVKLSFWREFRPINSHSIMHGNMKVWKQYIEPRLK
jgi:hypothetical protein